MDFELNDDQRSILEAVEGLLAQHAGPKRASELVAKGGYDSELETALQEAGFLDVARSDDHGPLEAALVVEAVARAAGMAAVGAAALVAPQLLEESPPGPVALCSDIGRALVRFGAHARTLLCLDGEAAWTARVEPGDLEPVASAYGYPFGRLRQGFALERHEFAVDAACKLRNWWRVALAVEMVGSMRAALDVTLEYVKGRRQFGRAIGSFQGVQHRLAECAVWLEGSRWLAYEAAWRGAPDEESALAAAHASATAQRIFAETHQFSGAMGYTREHDLHVWSMRLQALRLELAGVTGHRRAAAEARWAS